MPHHKFFVGQTVTLTPGRGDFNVPAGEYRIERQLPSENREFQYRVKYMQDGHERIVREGQLEAAPR